MELKDAQQKFIHAWGTLGSSWGINKTMAQIHALLLISPEPLSAEDIMEKLQVSRGNTNMNVRALIDWGLAHKVHITGERKEFFTSEKDVWEVAQQVARERQKRELSPIIKLLEETKEVKNDGSKDYKEFKKMNKEIGNFAKKMDSMITKLTKSDRFGFFDWIIKLVK